MNILHYALSCNVPMLLALLTASVFPSGAQAWGGVTTGKIAQMDIAGAGNLPLRVWLEGAPVLCTGGMAEGYLDDSNGNYKVFVAALMMAKANGTPVTLFADVGLFDRCRIGYVSIR